MIRMPIDSHADMYTLAKEIGEIGKLFKAISGQEKKISDARDRLASEYDQLARIKTEGARLLKEVAKKIEDLNLNKGSISGVDKSKVDPNDMKLYTKEAQDLDADVSYLSGVSDTIKTLSFQAKNVVEKVASYGEGFNALSQNLNKFIKADQILFDKKDKLTDKRSTMEDNKTEASRAYDQSKQDLSRRRDELLKEFSKFKDGLNAVTEKMKL